MENKNLNKANLDQGQIWNAIFDSNTDSLRVSVVDGVTLNVDNINIPELKTQQVPVVIKEKDIVEVKVPEIIKQIQVERIEIPVITKEIQIIEVEKPIIIPEVKIIEIEKPVIIKEVEIKVVEQKISEVPMIAKVCMVVQALALIGILLTKTL